MTDVTEVSYGDAISALREGEYLTAEALLVDLLEQNVRNPDVFVALGNSYYRQGRLSEAYGAYVQGAFQNPRDSDLLYNIQIVSEELEAQPPSLHWLSFEESCVLTSSCISLLFIALLSNRLRWRSWVILLAIFGMLASLSLGLNLWQQQDDGIVVQKTFVRSMRDKGVDLYTLNVGEYVTLKERDNQYWLIEHRNKGTGWIAESTLVPLNPSKNGESR